MPCADPLVASSRFCQSKKFALPVAKDAFCGGATKTQRAEAQASAIRRGGRAQTELAHRLS